MNLRFGKSKARIPVFSQLDLKDATLKIKDGGTESITVVIGEGNLTWTERKNIEYTLDRGTLDEVRLGDEVPVEVSFDFTWDYIEGSTTTTTIPPSVEDALKQINNAADWTSTDADNCRPYAVDLEFENIPACASADLETITLSDFRFEQLDHDARAGTVSVSGRCNITAASAVRAAQP